MLNGLEKIDLSAPDAIDQINALAGGLINKKTELEEKLSKAKVSLSAEESAQEKLTRLEASIEKDRLIQKENYSGALDLAKQESQSIIDKLNESSRGDKELIHELLVGNGIASEFVKLGVNSKQMEDLSFRFLAQASVVDGKAMVGDKSLSEAIQEWAETPSGKASRVAASNQGGDGLGGGGLPQAKTMKEMSGQERNTLFRENPTEFNRLKAEMQS